MVGAIDTEGGDAGGAAEEAKTNGARHLLRQRGPAATLQRLGDAKRRIEVRARAPARRAGAARARGAARWCAAGGGLRGRQRRERPERWSGPGRSHKKETS